jgi:hypothetical protein
LGGDRGGEKRKNERTGFGEPTARVLLLRETLVAIDLRWTAHATSGWIRPRWAKGKVAHAFAAFFFAMSGLDWAVFCVLGQNRIKFSSKFSVFLFSRRAE